MTHWRPAILIFCVSVLCSQPSGREQVGKMPDGSFMLPTGWRIKPVGRQIPLDTLPMSTALSKDGKYLLVLNGGYHPPSVAVIATDGMKEMARVPVADGWLGLTFSPDGSKVYVGGGSKYSVFEFSFSPAGELKPVRQIEISPGSKPGAFDFIGDVEVSPDGRFLYAAELYRDSIAVIDAQSGRVTAHHKTGRRPYKILFDPGGKSYFVSSWADGAVYQYEAKTGLERSRIRLGPHTTDMALSGRKVSDDSNEYRLFVSASNTNSVFVVGVDNAGNMKIAETLNVAMTPRQPAGMTPSGLALSPDQNRLFVACSDANVAAVADISGERGRVEGFVPAGWYPVGVRILADGRLLILNGRGGGSYPNSHFPGPMSAALEERQGDGRREYVASMQTGTMSVVDPLTQESLDEYTRAAMELSPYRDSQLEAANVPPDSVIYSRPEKPSPIQHVVYIIKENRTYDQVFGKIGKGNGDPSLTLFDESAAPNHYKLAREFVLFDNYYSNADVSADGHNWSTAGIAPDYTQKTWPSQYARRLPYYGYEGGEPANTPPAGYIWSNARSAGLSVRDYGEFVENKKQAGPDGVQVAKVNDPSLEGIVNMRYRSFDLDYPDVERARVFLEDLKQFEASGQMPRLMIVRLGNDHTNGTTPGKLTPLSLFADNDYALGLVVEGISKSRFWPSTAIFSIEDDAQNGPDHVDSHRSVLLAISPYTRRGAVDSTLYNQSSVMRTIELILGLRPMTQFDAAARPLTAAFAAVANPAPYAAEPPRISLTQRNPEISATAAKSAKMDFRDADQIDDDELNDILYLAIKGEHAPSPVRSFFSR
ncbi:MAG TPA: bifunctional YncE family protein/alkaline phosphatase family protein [Bryobacteraceae bacterium]|nr:bifunctional YncE family protein/alkaline phosphatase family protein [Bryobacteraceae bacterium]